MTDDKREQNRLACLRYRTANREKVNAYMKAYRLKRVAAAQTEMTQIETTQIEKENADDSDGQLLQRRGLEQAV